MARLRNRKMDNAYITDHLQKRFTHDILMSDSKDGPWPVSSDDILTVIVTAPIIHDVIRFLKENDRSILIEDNFTLTKTTQSIVWQMMTTADIEIVSGGAILRKDGKELKLENIAHPELTLSVVSLDPPPFYLDRKIDGLKRIEIRLPAWTVKTGTTAMKVRLSGK